MWVETVLYWLCVIVLVLSVAAFAFALRVRLIANDGLFDPFVEDRGRRLDGKFAIVTGGNRGIGWQTALALAKRGAHVTIACRNELRGKRAERQLNEHLVSEFAETKGKVSYANCDLSKMPSVKKFIKDYLRSSKPLHFLVNNAGMAGGGRFKSTADGVEFTMQINYLAHFLLTHSLLPLMVRSAKESRIVNVSSVWHKHGSINVDLWKSDSSVQKKAWQWRVAYGSSKLAQIVHAKHLQSQVLRKYKLPVCVFSAHPGGVDTDIFGIDKQPWFIRAVFQMFWPCWKIAMRTPEAGAQTSLHCLVSDFETGVLQPGEYHSSNRVGMIKDECNHGRDAQKGRELWDWSMEVLKLEEYDYSSLVSQSEDTMLQNFMED